MNPCALEDKSKCEPSASNEQNFAIEYCLNCRLEGKKLWAEQFPSEVNQNVLRLNEEKGSGAEKS